MSDPKPTPVPKDSDTRWSGRCASCGITWWWKREGSTIRRDILSRPCCPNCDGVLSRTVPSEKHTNRKVSRARVGLS